MLANLITSIEKTFSSALPEKFCAPCFIKGALEGMAGAGAATAGLALLATSAPVVATAAAVILATVGVASMVDLARKWPDMSDKEKSEALGGLIGGAVVGGGGGSQLKMGIPTFELGVGASGLAALEIAVASVSVGIIPATAAGAAIGSSSAMMIGQGGDEPPPKHSDSSNHDTTRSPEESSKRKNGAAPGCGGGAGAASDPAGSPSAASSAGGDTANVTILGSGSESSDSGNGAASSSGPLKASIREIVHENVKQLPKGQRPDPATYIPLNEVKVHLAKFRKGGVIVVSRAAFDRITTNLNGSFGREDGVFIMPREEFEIMLERSKGNPSVLERELGFPPGYLKKNKLVRIDVLDPTSLGLRMPSGNEAGVNNYWLPGGKLPGGASEAVVNRLPAGSFTSSDL